jgi:DNA-binding transcriptional LysR family regulator
VRFGLPEDFASVFLSDVLSEYASLHPRILLNVECDLTLNLFERFKKQEFDLVLVKMNRPEDFPNGMDVWSEALEWVGNKDLFEQEDQPVSLVLSPQPCVYRTRAIHALETMKKKWRIVFSSHSYAGTIAAVKAGMGVTVLPRNMVPDELDIIRTDKEAIPNLDDTHISLLKHHDKNVAVNSFEKFVIDRLKP